MNMRTMNRHMGLNRRLVVVLYRVEQLEGLVQQRLLEQQLVQLIGDFVILPVNK